MNYSRKFSPLLFSLLALSATFGTVPQVEGAPHQSAKIAAISKPPLDTVLIFPSDKTMGQLWGVRVTDGNIAHDRIPLGNARGAVHVASDSKISLELSYRGAEDLAPLLSLKPGIIVSMNCANLDNMSDSKLEELSKMPGVIQLNLDGTDVSDRAMLSIARMKTLTDLNIASTGIGPDGLRLLKNLAALQNVHVDCNKMPGTALRVLTSLKNLKGIYAHRCGLSNASLAEIGKCQGVERLNLAQNTLVSDQGMASLSAMPNVMILDVAETSITAGSFPYFKRMTKLKELTITDTRITAEQAQDLRRMLPPSVMVKMSRKPKMDPSTFAPLK